MHRSEGGSHADRGSVGDPTAEGPGIGRDGSTPSTRPLLPPLVPKLFEGEVYDPVLDSGEMMLRSVDGDRELVTFAGMLDTAGAIEGDRVWVTIVVEPLAESLERTMRGEVVLCTCGHVYERHESGSGTTWCKDCRGNAIVHQWEPVMER